MPERTSYAPGTPSWVDIGCDVEQATAFYGSLFGWAADAAGPAEETGGYGMFSQDGHLVAGFGPQQNPGPPFWSTYVTVGDADGVVTRVKEAGGQIVLDPMDVMDAGRMAVFQDPQGAFCSIWQPRQHIGAQLVNEPVSLCWNELNTRDLEGSKIFYSAVFGWDCVTSEMPGGMTYTEVKNEGDSVAGMMTMPDQVPVFVPPHWLVYFAVADTDATAATCKELGGGVMAEPMDIPPGRMAVLIDDQGATFAILRLNPTG